MPKWNFHKLLIDKEGKIADTYSSMTGPNDQDLIKMIETLLNS